MKKKTGQKNIKSVVDFISEAGMLKRVARSGWSVLGVQNPESVADHSFRCAVISFALAHLEKANAHRALLMALFNDIHEARLTDLHKMAQRYIDTTQPDDNAFHDQVSALPGPLGDSLTAMHKEYVEQKTKESVIARDADILECLIQAKEYHEFGYAQAHKFMQKAPGFLRTKSAKLLWKHAKKADLNDWWVTLSDFKR